jgi:TolA-binding protein
MRNRRMTSTQSLSATLLLLILFAVGSIVAAYYEKTDRSLNVNNAYSHKEDTNQKSINSELDQLSQRVDTLEQNVYQLQVVLEDELSNKRNHSKN